MASLIVRKLDEATVIKFREQAQRDGLSVADALRRLVWLYVVDHTLLAPVTQNTETHHD